MTQRHIITVSLESIKTKRQLKALFHDERLHVENTEAREGFETYRIPINKRLFVLEVCPFTNTHCKPQQRLDRYFLLVANAGRRRGHRHGSGQGLSETQAPSGKRAPSGSCASFSQGFSKGAVAGAVR